MASIEELDARIQSRMDAMDKRLADRMSALDARWGGGNVPEAENPLADRMATVNTRLRGNVAEVAKRTLDPLEAWLQPDFADVQTLFDYVRRSRVVLDNPQYNAALENVDLVYLTDPAVRESNSVNAGASAGGGRFKIAIYAGLARQSRIAGSALASKDGVEKFKRLLKIVEDEPGWAASISLQEAKNLFVALGLRLDDILGNEVVRQEAFSRSSAGILATLAHEAGHIALGHVNARVDYYNVNREVARMQERQADSFMSSVISTVPFGEHIFEAELFNDYLNVVAEKTETGDSRRTHPLSLERFNNLLKDHPDLADRYGLKPLNAV